MKATICLLAALLILPTWGSAAAQKDIHTAMAAAEEEMPRTEETRTSAQTEENTPAQETADAGGDSSEHTTVQDEPSTAAAEEDKTADPSQEEQEAAAAAAYGVLTAIAPVTLADGDWIFIEGDERRGWFFDRTRMARNSDGSISYWQLILYNDLGRDQFVHAMQDEAYETLGYTLQRRVLNPKANTIRTYEIIAYDGENAVIANADRDGHAAEIQPDTMAEKERDAVKKAAKKLQKQG